jgi:serine/threonine-protein kinase
MIGKTLLHYRIIEKLGEGGMGVVYLAEDTKLRRKVAIKFLPRHIAADTDERKRFEIEAQATAAINHPNIATIHAIEEVEDSQGGRDVFIVLEYIDGQDLRNCINTKQLSIEDVTDIAIQLANGLQTAHEKGIIHRDIKSANIMMTEKGQVKIMDFGLAKLHGGSQLTKIGSTLGTMAFMSPEQIRGEEVDDRADIWSFGVVLYELLTKTQPFTGTYEQAVMYSIINEDPLPLINLNKDVPPGLEYIVNKCLEKEPSNRYQTVSELLADMTNKAGKKRLDPEILTSKKIPFKHFPVQSRSKLILATIGLLLFIIILLLLRGRNWFLGPDEQHLLVLPFTNVGGDLSQQAFCDGLVETLTSKLSQLEQYHGSLWVVPSSEVQRNKISSPSEARQTFGINLVVSGSLQIFDDMFRLTLNLIDAKNIRQLNSTVIDIKATQLSALQDQSVIKLLEMLNLELTPNAHSVLQSGATSVPGAYEFYLQGRGYIQRYENPENLDAAINLFTNAIELDPGYALAHAGLGEAYWRKYEASKETLWVDKAIKECKRAFELDGKLAPVNVTLGIIHAGKGKYNDAIDDFNRALNTDPTNADAYRGLAKVYETQELLPKAESTYKKAISLKMDYWAGYNDLGVFYYRHGRYEEAIEQFHQVIALTPDNYRGYNNLGGIYYLLERWEEARKMFEYSFKLRKSHNVASNLGTLYYIEGRYANAARMYEKALELNNNDFLIWGNLASAYYWAPDERDKANKYYRHAVELAQERIKINPNDADVIAQLAGYYSMIGEPGKAEAMIEKALKLAPRDVQVMYRAAAAYEQLEKREKALYWIAKALENGYSRSEIEHQPELQQLIADERFQQLQNSNSNHKEKL